MENQNNRTDQFIKILSYVLVALATACLTFVLTLSFFGGNSKLDELEALIDQKFVGEVDRTAIEDAAASAMVDALGDRWSYYIPASQYDAYVEQMQNAYVGIGITIAYNEEAGGFDILQVEPTGGAKAAGILPGDLLVEVDGQGMDVLGLDGAAALVRGEEGSQVEVTVLRDGEKLTFQVTRQVIQVQVAAGQMLTDQVGYVQIANFDERCAEETIAAIDELVSQGAKSLIFDVRFNPGGFKEELVKILDHLLPEGVLFHSVSYDGYESKDYSDEACLELPFAVLINADSYSAAEFFAAALNEYDRAVLVGEPTTGKSYFQNTFQLSDGSAVGLSVGKYYTPNGVSLAEEGGLQPEVLVELDEETAANVYAGLVAWEEDPQIQAALDALK